MKNEKLNLSDKEMHQSFALLLGKQEQSYWNSGEMQYELYQRLLDKWTVNQMEIPSGNAED